MTTKSQAQRQRARFQKQVTRLRDLGLTGTRKIDLRKSPSKSTTNLIKKYADVLAGKAAVVRIPKSEKKRFKGIFPVVGDTIIVPKVKGERNVRYDPKAGEVVSKVKRGKRTYNKVIFRDLDKLKEPSGDRQRYFSVPFKRGKGRKGKIDYQTYDSLNELKLFMNTYVEDGRYKDWARYVQIYDAESLDDLYEHLKNPNKVFYDGEDIAGDL